MEACEDIFLRISSYFYYHELGHSSPAHIDPDRPVPNVFFLACKFDVEFCKEFLVVLLIRALNFPTPPSIGLGDGSVLHLLRLTFANNGWLVRP